MPGERHPDALGLALPEAWPDVWPEIAPLVERVFAGETVRFEDMPLVTTRHGYPEKTWWTFSYSPVRDESGAVAGLLNVTVDTTRHVRAERERDQDHARLREQEERQAFLLKLSDALRILQEPEQIYAEAEDHHWMVTRGHQTGVAPLPDQPFAMAAYAPWIIEGFRVAQPLVVEDMQVRVA